MQDLAEETVAGLTAMPESPSNHPVFSSKPSK
jgi:hypothetical protein